MTANGHRAARGGLLLSSLLLFSLVHQVDAGARPVSPRGADHAGARPALPVAADREGGPAIASAFVSPEGGMAEPCFAVESDLAAQGSVQSAPTPEGTTLDPGGTAVRSALDCNGNGTPDAADIANGFSLDVNTNGIPDECDFPYCDPLWDGFSDYTPGQAVTTIDVNGDGYFWRNPLGSATIQNVGCEGGGIDFGVGVTGDWNLADPTTGYVESEYLRTVNGALDCGSAIYTLTFQAKLSLAINSKLDWEYYLYDAQSGKRVVQLEFPSTASTKVPTAQRGKVLVKNPTGSPTYLSTNVAITLNGCLTFKIELNNVTDTVAVYVNDLVTPKVVTTRQDAAAHRVDYFRIQAIKNSASSGGTFSRFCLDKATACVSGSALMTWTDCNANCVDDAWELAGGSATDCNTNGTLDDCDIATGASWDCNENILPDECENLHGAPVLYVDADAPGSNNGTSWDDALHELRAALCLAARASTVAEIRVAEGVYKPAGAGGLRTRTLQLVNGVALLGGYAGYGHADPDKRDVELYETILSGDLNGDDGPEFANNTENSYHVVTGSGTGPTTRLDGFTITAGNANAEASTPEGRGGGLYIDAGALAVERCTFRQNRAAHGGAMATANNSEPTIQRCTFAENSARSAGQGYNGQGGAVYNADSAPRFAWCEFSDNWAPVGGAMRNNSSSVRLTNCRFVGNTAWVVWGGAVDHILGELYAGNCAFIGNRALGATGYVGGVSVHYAGTFVNCLFAANSAESAEPSGGGLSLYDDTMAKVVNCVFWGNSDMSGTGETAQIHFVEAVLDLAHSDVQGWTGSWGGIGNFGSDPLFVDPVGPDGIFGTADDDLRLSAGSPCIDAGSNGAVPADLTDLDADGDTAERMPFDLFRKPRFVDDPATLDTGVADPPDYPAVVDLGAYEYQGIPCDLTYDGVVDEADYWALVDAAGTCMGQVKYVAAADLDGDGCVTIVDYQQWLQCYRTVNGRAFSAVKGSG
jgi:hypothetical protein